MNTSLGSCLRRIDAILALYDSSMECIFHKRLTTRRAVETHGVAFIVCKQRLTAGRSIEISTSQRIRKLEIVKCRFLKIIGNQRDMADRALKSNQRLPARRISPSPRVTEPQ